MRTGRRVRPPALILWLRVRRAKAIVIALAGFASLTLLAGDVALAMPPLLASYGLSVPVVLLGPLLISAVVGWGVTSGESRLEQVSSRPIPLFDVVLAVGAAAVACGFGVVIGVLAASPYAGAAGRNALGYVGLLMVAAPMVGIRAGSTVPPIVVIVAALVGGDPSGHPRWWVWPLMPVGDAFAWISVLSVLVLGIVMTVRRGFQS